MTKSMQSVKDFNRSFKIQLRVIYALLMREIITRYGRHNIGFAWLFVEPMVFTLGISVLWYATKSVHGDNISIVPFAITGYSTILCWRNAANRTGNAVDANTGLLYHRNVKVIDVYLARILLEVLGATISFLILSLFYISIDLMALPADFMLMVKAWILLIWFTIGLSFVIGALFEMSEVVDRLWHALTYLLFPLSGAAFLVSWLPDNFKEIILYLPMVHATEMLRHGYYGDAIRTYENGNYLIWVNMTLSFIGLMLVRYTNDNIEASS